jgi:hypothetical protein
MPSRWLSLTIIAFWLGTSGWFFWHDLWPDWRPGEPPPYKADLVEEAQRPHKADRAEEVQRRQGRGRTNTWIVYHNNEEAFTAETWVDHQVEDDTFVMESLLSPRPPIKSITPKWLPRVELRRASGSYRVDRDGNLVGVRAEFSLWIPPKNDLILKGLEAAKGFRGNVVLALTGDIRDGRLFPHWHIDNQLGREYNLQFPPIAVPSRGAVVMPLQPVNRLRGLRPGATWRVPLLEPLAMVGLGDGVKYLSARVRPATEPLDWNGEQFPCLVIEYQGEDVTGRTWVAVGPRGEDRVLRQEFDLAGEVRWVVRRVR